MDRLIVDFNTFHVNLQEKLFLLHLGIFVRLWNSKLHCLWWKGIPLLLLTSGAPPVPAYASEQYAGSFSHHLERHYPYRVRSPKGKSGSLDLNLDPVVPAVTIMKLLSLSCFLTWEKSWPTYGLVVGIDEVMHCTVSGTLWKTQCWLLLFVLNFVTCVKQCCGC